MSYYDIVFPKYGRMRLLSVWVKGKKPKLPEDYRFLMVGDDNKTYVFWLSDHPVSGKCIMCVDGDDLKVVSENQLKNGCYNYYRIDNDNDDTLLFDNMIKEYVDSDPMVPENLQSYMHTNYSNLKIKYDLIVKV